MYPYYAGFEEGFVQSWLDVISPGEHDVVLDPWNGSGTTTTVCSRNDVSSIGIDLNPYMRAVSTARIANRSDWSELIDLLGCKAFRFSRQRTPLPDAASLVFKKVFGTLHDTCRSYWIAMFLVGAALRKHSTEALSRNPTWFSRRKLNEIEITGRELFDSVYSIAEGMRRGCSQTDRAIRISPQLVTADVTNMNLDTDYHHILTSPPYLTRIDYVQKTLPETQFAVSMCGGDLNELRKSMLGSVLTSDSELKTATTLTPRIQSILSDIEKHESKASATYYARFFTKYFVDLEISLKKLCDRICNEGSITLVTQGSYYKESFIDLPCVIEELMDTQGWSMQSDASFRATNSLAQVNRRSFASTQAPPDEVVQIFGMKR